MHTSSSGRQRSEDVAGSLLSRAASDTATSIFQRRCGRPVMEHRHCGWPADHANAHAQAAGEERERPLPARGKRVLCGLARDRPFVTVHRHWGTAPPLWGSAPGSRGFRSGEELQWSLRDAQGDPQESPRCFRPAPTPWDETPGELTRLGFPGTARLFTAGMPSSRGAELPATASDHLTIPREGGHSSREKTSTAHRKPNSSMGPWSSGTCRGGIVLRSPSGTPLLEQRSACGHGNIYTDAVLSLVEIVNLLAARTLREPEEEKRAQFLREEDKFLGREDKDGLRCKRSPRLKTGDLNVQLAKELETTKLLSGRRGGGSKLLELGNVYRHPPGGSPLSSGVHRALAKLTGLNLQTRGTRSLVTPSDPESAEESGPECTPGGLKRPPPLGDQKKKVSGGSGVRTVGLLHC
ncbi:hypothetical protein P7K49_023441 [Saguinus oedipus]|uniref:Uncharacterized protein n=1 Tax=Saguinus oedipus TaxID=9490 RepID=A0ABQ9UMG9_SAGOE|nr:hypothetical protein P7K49_023441 [Saguinus oedipus]